MDPFESDFDSPVENLEQAKLALADLVRLDGADPFRLKLADAINAAIDTAIDALNKSER